MEGCFEGAKERELGEEVMIAGEREGGGVER